MLTFRKKILLSYLIVFLVLVGLMFPFASQSVRGIAIKAMNDRAEELILRIKHAQNDDGLIRNLKEQKALIFFRVSVITNEHKVIYDSHARRILGADYSNEFIIEHPEVNQAFKSGSGYHEDYSELLGQDFAYVAKSFDFNGQPYVIRLAFPLKYVQDLTADFEMGFFVLITSVLLLFSLMTWFVINHLTRPIQQIIQAVTPYQEGKTRTVPLIEIKSGATDEFGKLASTFNSLSAKIQGQINSLTQERNEKQAILESLAEGVIAVDQDLNVIYANEMALKLLGKTAEELAGSFEKVGQPNLTHLLQTCQKEHKVLNDTMVVKRVEGKIFLDIVAAPREAGLGALLVLQDKSSHYKMLEMRKDFIANASHELKTPITIIRGFAETLHDNPELPLETTVDITGKIVRNCKRMTTLIKDLLTLTDIEHLPESRLIDCDLLSLVHDCIEMLHNVFPEAVVEVDVQDESATHMEADPNLMELALMNLIENAAKYSISPAKVKVSLKREGDTLILSVTDNGIGISPADLEHIFERFFTVNKAKSQKMGGSGLGLSIVETIVTKHLGTIAVQSEIDKGTTFTLRLPVKR